MNDICWMLGIFTSELLIMVLYFSFLHFNSHIWGCRYFPFIDVYNYIIYKSENGIVIRYAYNIQMRMVLDMNCIGNVN